jgi:hypothetical protein
VLELRQKTKEALKDEASSGKLQGQLKSKEAEEIQKKAQAALCEATLTGKLQEIVKEITGKEAALPELLKKTQEALCEAALTGKLNEAVFKSIGPEEALAVRQKVQQALNEAALTGKLNEIVVALTGKEAPDLQEKVRGALYEAALTGKLDEKMVELAGAVSQESGSGGYMQLASVGSWLQTRQHNRRLRETVDVVDVDLFDIDELPFKTEEGQQKAIVYTTTAEQVKRLHVAFGGNAMVARDCLQIFSDINERSKGATSFVFVDYPGFGFSAGTEGVGSVMRAARGALDEALSALDARPIGS